MLFSYPSGSTKDYHLNAMESIIGLILYCEFHDLDAYEIN